jgi:hypothetical protein
MANTTVKGSGVNQDYYFENNSFSGTDIVAIAHMKTPDGKASVNYALGEIQTISYSVHMERFPIRAAGNVNAKDYVMGPRTIAGTLIFAVFDKHWAKAAFENINDELKLNPRYKFVADELPPFDITISFANEYGVQARMALYGVRLINEGQVMSVNDVYTENTYQFVATDIDYMNDEEGYATFNQPSNVTTITSKISSTPGTTNLTRSNSYTIPSFNNIHPNSLLPIRPDQNMINNNPTKPILSVSTTLASDSNSDGYAKFILTPVQTKGTINVTGAHMNYSISVPSFPSQGIYLKLPIGLYTAVYINGDTVSNYQGFEIDAAPTNIINDNNLVAPIIDSVTTNSITVRSNVQNHTFVKYHPDMPNPIILTAPLVGHIATIDKLYSGTRYIVYTSDGKTDSKTVAVRTLEYDAKPFDDIKTMMLSNITLLVYEDDIQGYYDLLSQAQQIQKTSRVVLTALDSLCILKSDIHALIVAAATGSFPSEKDRQEYIAAKMKLEEMCGELICFAKKVMNDKNYANNFLSHIDPPVAEQKDFLNSVLLLDINTIAIEIYKITKTGKIKVAMLDSSKIYDYNFKKKACKFNGVPGNKYDVYAVGLDDIRSPKYELYIMTDSEKALAINKYNNEKKIIDDRLSKAKIDAANMINELHLSDEGQARAIIQFAKKPSNAILTAPTITDVGLDHITVMLSDLETQLAIGSQCIAVLSTIEESLEIIPVYKKRFTIAETMITFSSDDNGVRPNTSYAIWIENSDGEQISDCATTTTSIDETDITELENMVLYKVNAYIDLFIKNLSNKIAITGTVKEAIDSLRSNVSSTIGNISANIITALSAIKPQPSNYSDLIFAVLYSKLETDGIVVDKFFMDSLSSSYRGDDKITINYPICLDDYTIITYNVGADGTTTTNGFNISAGQSYNKDTSIDANTLYVAQFAINGVKKTRSGLVFYDVARNKFKVYRISMEGIQ